MKLDGSISYTTCTICVYFLSMPKGKWRNLVILLSLKPHIDILKPIQTYLKIISKLYKKVRKWTFHEHNFLIYFVFHINSSRKEKLFFPHCYLFKDKWYGNVKDATWWRNKHELLSLPKMWVFYHQRLEMRLPLRNC